MVTAKVAQLTSNEEFEKIKENLSPSDIGDYTNCLIGRILTIVDASFGDAEQRNAFKQIIKRTIWDTNNDFWYEVLRKEKPEQSLLMGQ